MTGTDFAKRVGRWANTITPGIKNHDRLVLRQHMADVVDIFDMPVGQKFPPTRAFHAHQTLEDEIYYLSTYPSERNKRTNISQLAGIVVKGTDKVIGSVDFPRRHEDDVGIGYILSRLLGPWLCAKQRALIDLGFKFKGALQD